MRHIACVIFCIFISHLTYAKPEFVLDLAYSDMHIGKAQHINMLDLIGNDYTLDQSRQSNVLLGLSYYHPLDALSSNINVVYGLNLAYFNTNNIHGQIVQESLFSNLSYSYSLINLPIYASVKSRINSWVFETGIGPNVMFLYDYHENKIEPNTLARQTFLSSTSLTFSANAGVAYQFQTPLFKNPIELGYRFYYLGKGQFKPSSDQVLTALQTANIYANTLICSITFMD